MNRELNKHFFENVWKTGESILCWKGEDNYRENNAIPKAEGRQGTSLILGGVNKPNGQQEGSWQEVMEP